MKLDALIKHHAETLERIHNLAQTLIDCPEPFMISTQVNGGVHFYQKSPVDADLWPEMKRLFGRSLWHYEHTAASHVLTKRSFNGIEIRVDLLECPAEFASETLPEEVEA